MKSIQKRVRENSPIFIVVYFLTIPLFKVMTQLSRSAAPTVDLQSLYLTLAPTQTSGGGVGRVGTLQSTSDVHTVHSHTVGALFNYSVEVANNFQNIYLCPG